MKKICLTVVGIYILLLHAFAQTSNSVDTAYEPKPLKLDEINLVSSYYNQNGDHSAILGGIGNEHVVDLANGLELNFVGWDARKNKHTITAGLGFDHHTSASAAYVSKTGASKTGGTRVYPSFNWLVENENKGTSFGLGAYYSAEYNYHSLGLDASYSKKTNNNGQFDGKISAYFDQVKLIYPSELIPVSSTPTTSSGATYITTASGNTVLSGGGGYTDEKPKIPSAPRNTYDASLTFSQVINKRLQASVMLDLVSQSGYLGLPFHRVYFNDGTDHVENLPSLRYKIPIGIRLNYFAGDNLIIRAYYRYYFDQWGIQSHTIDLEVPVKITPFFSLSPFYRYYIQTAARYFAPYGVHTASDQYYSSNYALSALSSNFFGMGLRLSPPDGILKTHLSNIEVRYGHYLQTTDLLANIVSFAFQLK